MKVCLSVVCDLQHTLPLTDSCFALQAQQFVQGRSASTSSSSKTIDLVTSKRNGSIKVQTVSADSIHIPCTNPSTGLPFNLETELVIRSAVPSDVLGSVSAFVISYSAPSTNATAIGQTSKSANSPMSFVYLDSKDFDRQNSSDEAYVFVPINKNRLDMGYTLRKIRRKAPKRKPAAKRNPAALWDSELGSDTMMGMLHRNMHGAYGVRKSRPYQGRVPLLRSNNFFGVDSGFDLYGCAAFDEW